MGAKGTPRYLKNTVPILMDRHVEKTESCWLWRGALATNGYSKTKLNGRSTSAHRVMYEYFVGPIPKGMQIDHLCRNRACVNPRHLELVTPRENTLRSQNIAAVNARKIVCIRGHALTGSNLYVTPDGRRQCRVCGNARSAPSHRRA